MKNTKVILPKAFIFDLDGTLLDSMPLWDDVYSAPFRDADIDVPEGYLLAVNHLSLKDCADYTLKNTPLSISEQKLVDIWNKHSHYAYENTVPLKEGAKELLGFLHDNGVRLAVATALPYDLFVPCLKRLEVYGLFDCFVSTDDVSKGKDSPEVYLRAARKLGLQPSDCVVAEDSHIGIKSAKDADFSTVGVYDKTSEKYTDLIRSFSDFYAKSPSDIVQALKDGKIINAKN